jgi:iron(III) transport system permease protein
MEAFKRTDWPILQKPTAKPWLPKRRISHFNIANLIFAGTIGIITYLVLGPLVFLLWSSFRSALPTPADPGYFTVENYLFAYTNPTTYYLFLNTAVFVLISTAISVFVAFTLAWLIERTNIPAKKTLFVLILLPAAVPSMLMAMAYIILAGPEAGILNIIFDQLLGFKPINIYSRFWLFLLNGLHGVPATFLILIGALRSMDPSLEDAASVSGVSRIATVRRVTLPMMLPAILAAAIYTGMSAAETFELPTLIGVPIGFHVFSSQVYLSVRVWGNHTLASAYSVIFLGMLVALIYFYQRATRQMYRYTTISGKGYRPRLIPIGRWRWLAVAFVGSFYLVTGGLPLLVFLGSSFFPDWRTLGLGALRQPTLDSFRSALGNTVVLDSLKHTAFITLATPIMTVGLISVISWLIVRSNLSLRAKTALDALTFWPHAYPGIVLGVALLWFFIMVDFPPVWGTLWPVIFGLTISYMPFTVRTLNAAFIQVHKELEEAAYASGASWFATFRKILLPLVIPAMASAALWIAIHAMRSLTVPMFLTTHGNDVLAVLVWTYWESNMVESVAVIGLLYLVICAILSLVWRRLSFKDYAG